MSTRATYEFKPSSNYSIKQTFYIHHDGYESGCAFYLYNAINFLSRPQEDDFISSGFEPCGDGLMGAFYRGNRNAEFTQGHDAHGDTEFRYTIDCSRRTVMVQKKSRDGSWKTVGVFSVAEFVNQNIDKSWVDDFSPVIDNGSVLFTAGNGEAVADLLEKKALGFHESNPNRNIYMKRAEGLRGSIRA